MTFLRLLIVPFLLVAASLSNLQDTLVTNAARSNGPKFTRSLELFVWFLHNFIFLHSTPAPATSSSLETSSSSQPPTENGVSTLPIRTTRLHHFQLPHNLLSLAYFHRRIQSILLLWSRTWIVFLTLGRLGPLLTKKLERRFV